MKKNNDSCKKCRYGSLPMSEEYKRKGYVGCLYCQASIIEAYSHSESLKEDCAFKGVRPMDFYLDIKERKEFLGFGWVDGGFGSYNEMAIFTSPIKCKMFEFMKK